MERVVNIAKDQDEAFRWDVKQALSMFPEERQKVALALKKRAYGEKPDIRKWEKKDR